MKVDYSRRIFGLDVMRAAAILFVVVSHALWVFPEEDIPLSSLIRFSGFIGVEIFFVLSGFLIGRIMLRLYSSEDYQPRQLVYFLIRRWFRTLPNYYLILLVNIAIAIYIGRQLPETLPQYFLFLQNFSSGMDIFFTESWSLPIEEFAYILGPLALYLVALPKTNTSRERRFLWVTIGIILFFLGTKLMYHLNHGGATPELWNIELKAVVAYRIDAIYYGVLAAYIAIKSPRLWKRFKGEVLVIGFFLFALFHVIIGKYGLNSESVPLLFNVFYFPICSILIATTLPFLSDWRKAPVGLLRPITFISLISYSMYLLHYSIVLQLMRYELKIDPESSLYQWVFSVGYLTITILLSYLLYRIYERPMMNLRDHPVFKKWSRSN